VTRSSSPFSPTASAWTAGVLLVAALSRVFGATQAVDRAPPRVLLHRPWQHPPVLDLLTLPLASHRGVVILALAMAAVVVSALLAREALGRRGALVVMALSAICPSLVFSGSFWGHHAPVIPGIALLALLLTRSLTGSFRGGVAPIAVVTAITLLSDWPAWAPVLAWGAWLAVFRPPSLSRQRARHAAAGLGLGALLAMPVYGWMFIDIGDPGFALGARSMPTGLAAIEALLDALAGLLLADPSGHSLGLRCGAALTVVVTVSVGAVRASRFGSPLWASVLVMGTAGALVPALAIHPWLPIAAGKNIWYMSPLVLCLTAAALWPATDNALQNNGNAPTGPPTPA